MKRFLLFSLLLLSCLLFGMTASSAWAWPEDVQSLILGISYLDMQKSFLDFPITWKSTMPVMSASYQFSTGRFEHGISFVYGRSTYIKINDSERWGSNGFSIMGFRYNFVWYNSHRKENQNFFWGIGASLENIRIDQKVEISPAKYNRYEDRYFGIGPVLSLFWKLERFKFGFYFGSTVSIPHTSYSIMRSNSAFCDRYNLWWIWLASYINLEYRILKACDLSIDLRRDALAFGRSQKYPLKETMAYGYGAYLIRSLQVSLKYHF